MEDLLGISDSGMFENEEIGGKVVRFRCHSTK
jgi:hypothetical protein